MAFLCLKTLLNIMYNYFTIFHMDRTCNFYQGKKRWLKSLGKGDKQTLSMWLISAGLAIISSAILCRKTADESLTLCLTNHLISLLSYSLTQVLNIDALTGFWFRQKENKCCNSKDTQRFPSTRQSSYHRSATKGLRNIYSLKMANYFRHPQHHRWQRSRTHSDYPCSPNTVKLPPWVDISHPLKPENPTWATFALPK